MPTVTRLTTKKAKKMESVGVVYPLARAHMPMKAKAIPEYNGTNKMERFMHQMQVQQNLILSKFGIDAPILDLSGLNDSDDDSGLDNDADDKCIDCNKPPELEPKTLEPDATKAPKTVTMKEIKERDREDKRQKAAEKRRLKKAGKKLESTKEQNPRCLELPSKFVANGFSWKLRICIRFQLSL